MSVARGSSSLSGAWLLLPFLLFESQTPCRASPPPCAEKVKAIAQLGAERRYPEAVELAERTVREYADDATAWIALARVHLDPEYLYRRPARAESAARRALKLVGRRPDVLGLLAQALFDQSEHEEALRLIAEVVDAPAAAGSDVTLLSDLLVLRAEIRLRQSPQEPALRTAALADLGRAVELLPRGGRARLVRGEALLGEGRTEEALADFEVAVSTRPGSRQAHYELFVAESQLGRKDEAKRHYEIWKRLNRLIESVAQENAPDAAERRQLLRELAQLNPADLAHRLDLAELEVELGDVDAAKRDCDELAALGVGGPRLAAIRERAARRAPGSR